MTYILTNILEETNRYGEQYVQAHEDHLQNHPKARAHNFVKQRFGMEEVLRFLMLVITMGVVDLPSLKNYWSTSWPFHSSNFSTILSRDCFFLLLKFLHLVDNTNQVRYGQPGHDRLFKLRLFIEPIVKQFQEVFVQQRELSID